MPFTHPPHRGRMEDRSTTVREARRRFFAASGFAPDGGYDDEWADAELGPFAYRVPNLAARAAALRVHDLHHLVTGYPTDWKGEAQISAWELGSGWGRYPYAWIIAIFGLLTGVLAMPGATLRAFARGRRSRGNLYGFGSIDEWLDRPLSELEAALGVPRHPGRAHAADLVRFALLGTASVLFGALALPALGALWVMGVARAWTLRDRSGCVLHAGLS